VIFRYTTAFPNTPPRPYLDIILRNGYYTSNKLMALVDSDADYSIFPAELADDLKLELADAPVWRFSGTTGHLQQAKLADVNLTILQENAQDHAFEVRTTCAFCDSFKFAGACCLDKTVLLAIQNDF